MRTIKAAAIGAGRIGRVHIENICTAVDQIELKTVADPYLSEDAAALCKSFGVQNITTNVDSIFSDPEIEAVLIYSSTDTHADLIMKSAAAGKHIFCEKPVDHDIGRVREALAKVDMARVKFQIGFVRRYDHNHRGVYNAIRDGKIGTPHIIRIASRDPAPPTMEYVKHSGGIFFDMMIHDFDMIRFLAGSEAKEVYTQGAVLIDPRIGELGDVDTAVVTLTFENGAIGIIDNSRQAVYGYDQRLEVFGSKGMVQNDNDYLNTVVVSGAEATTYGILHEIMFDRYKQAFIDEMKDFADAVINDRTPSITGLDGLYPVLMAAAAKKSLEEGRPVKIGEIDIS